MTIQNSPPNMKNFNEWEKDKSPLLRLASFTLASSAETCLEHLKMLKSGKLIENVLYLPPIKQWLNLYRNHRSLYKGVSTAIRDLGSEMSKIVDFYEFIIENFNQTKKMTTEEKRNAIEKLSPEKLQQIVNEIRKAERELEAWILSLYNEDDLDIGATDEKEEKKIARKFLHTPEITFYFRVWIPCFLIHGTYPQYLLMKARHGDYKAIEKLLQIDKSIIDDPKIKEIFHQSAVASQRSKFALMSQAIKDAPKKRIDIKTVKYALAGLISLISIALRQELEPKKISDLFNVIAQDSIKDASGDDDITAGETFEKAVQRYRSFWQINLKKT